jgi:hypothetical protein
VNLADMTEMVRLRTGISATDTRMTAYIKRVLNMEYERTAAEEQLLEKVTHLSLVANSAVVDMPQDWQRTLQVMDAGSPIRPVTALEYAYAETRAYGPMVYLPQPPERILVAPVPTEDKAQGLTLIYVARPIPLTNDTDEPRALPREYHDLLVELTIMRVYLAEEDPNMMQAAQAQAAGIQARLRGHGNIREGQGMDRIVPPPARVRW